MKSIFLASDCDEICDWQNGLLRNSDIIPVISEKCNRKFKAEGDCCHIDSDCGRVE